MMELPKKKKITENTKTNFDIFKMLPNFVEYLYWIILEFELQGANVSSERCLDACVGRTAACNL